MALPGHRRLPGKMAVIMDAVGNLVPARRLAGALEPLAGQTQVSSECHAAYAELGFESGFDRAAYFSARGAVFGLAPAEVVAAAFAVFNPVDVIAGVNRGREVAPPEVMFDARQQGSVATLRRVLGVEPVGLDRAAVLLGQAVAPLGLE